MNLVGISWYIMVYHGISWYIMVYHYLLLRIFWVHPVMKHGGPLGNPRGKCRFRSLRNSIELHLFTLHALVLLPDVIGISVYPCISTINILLVGGFNHFFHSIWDNPSHWLVFFNMVKITNQSINGIWCHISIIFLYINDTSLIISL